MQMESSCRAEVRVKLEEEVKKLKNLIEGLKANAVEKDTVLIIYKKEVTSSVPFLERPKEQLSKSLRHPTSTLISWTRTKLRDLKISVWTRLSFFLR